MPQVAGQSHAGANKGFQRRPETDVFAAPASEPRINPADSVVCVASQHADTATGQADIWLSHGVPAVNDVAAAHATRTVN